MKRSILLIVALVFFNSCRSREDVAEICRDYLEKNPQIVQAAYQRLQPLHYNEPLAKDLPPLGEMLSNRVKVDSKDAPFVGPTKADITIVEFSDFQCSFCKRATGTIQALLKEYPGQIRWAYRQYPLPFHNMALPAAKASLAAHEQDKFWPMHDTLFGIQSNLNDESIRAAAKSIGLDMDRFEKSWKSDKFDRQIQEDVDFANQNGADGAPAFFVNGVLINGAKPIEVFRKLITALQASPQS